MILLDTQDVNLPFPLENPSAEITEWLRRAVKAQAILTDPLGYLTGSSNAKATFDLAAVLNWLATNATFSTELVEELLVEDVPLSDPLGIWAFIVSQLAERLIEQNYTQGWACEVPDPIFSLRYPVISDQGYTLKTVSMSSEWHWSQFVRAVIARATSPAKSETAADFVRGSVSHLAFYYPNLGELQNNGKYRAVSGTQHRAEIAWNDNISTAAAKLAEELARRE